MAIAERLEFIIKKKGLTKNSFSVSLGMHNTVVGNIVRGFHKPSYKFIEKVLMKYKDIDARWLITGEGHYKTYAEPNLSQEEHANYAQEKDALYWKAKYEACSEILVKVKTEGS